MAQRVVIKSQEDEKKVEALNHHEIPERYKNVSIFNTSSDGLLRRMKWEYVVPIIATPSAHIFVSMIRRYPQHRTKLLWGVAAATFFTVQTRLILMWDAGYPGEEKRIGELPWYLRIFLF